MHAAVVDRVYLVVDVEDGDLRLANSDQPARPGGSRPSVRTSVKSDIAASHRQHVAVGNLAAQDTRRANDHRHVARQIE